MQTGYPSIDKPWLARHVNNPNANFNLKETLYTTYVNACANRLDNIAIYVNDTKKQYTNRELLALIDRASIGFHSLGINENSKVGIFLDGSIEEAVTLLALSKLGAVSKYIDYLKGIAAIKHSLDETHLDLLVMDESFLPLNQLINDKMVPVVVANTSNYYDDDHLISYEKIYQIRNVESIPPAPYIDGKPAVMINSSGTTGDPKPIVHTNFSVNAAVQKMLYTDYPLYPGHVIIKTVPSQIGLGLITSLYTGLISGATVVLISSGKDVPELTGKLIGFVKAFGLYRQQNKLSQFTQLNIFTSPAFIRLFIKSDKITDLSYIGSILAAGSKISKEELDVLEQIAAKKGCKVPICNGYGQNEMAGAVTLNLIHHNVNGSAGFPTFKTNVIIVDPVSMRPLRSNKQGLILESSNSIFLEYENLKEKTKEAYITFPDGSRWFNTCDLGYMDKDGFLYIVGRISRIVIKSDFKISLDDLERKIKTLPFILDCAIIVPEHGGSDEQIVAYVKTCHSTEKDIKSMVQDANILSVFEMPSEFLVVDNISYKTNGKVDYELLKKNYLSKERGTR